MTAPKPITAHPRTDQWIAFETDKVIVRTGRVELGQGIGAALTRIAATELSVAPRQITLIAGDTRLSPNEGMTVGSYSVEVGGMALRWAASAARHELLARAAALLQTTSDALEVQDGAILNAGSDTGLTYWTLSEGAPLAGEVADWARPLPLAQHPPHDPAPRRAEMLARLQGRAFVHDLNWPDMLHGRVIHPPHGTRGLVTSDADLAGLAGDQVMLHRDGFCIGVTGEDEATINRAATHLRDGLVWDRPPLMASPLEMLDGAAAARDLATESGTPPETGPSVCVSVTRPCLAHGSIGACCAVARFTDGVLEVWAHSQGVFFLRDALAQVLGLRAEAVIVRFTPAAGCYGHNGADDVAMDAAFLAMSVPGQPVRALWSRADEFQVGPLAPAMRTTARAWLTSEGALDGFDIEVLSPPHGTRPRGAAAPNLRAASYLADPTPLSPSVDPPAASGGGSDRNAVPLYAADHTRVWKSAPARLSYRPSSMRGLGSQVNVTAIEAVMEEAAAQTGADPVDFRLAHLRDARARSVVETVRRMAERSAAPEGTTRGLGFARYKNSAAYCAVVTEILIETEIRVRRVWAAVDAGEVIEPSGLRNQIEGGLVQAASITLFEEIRFGPGGVETQSWDDYPILGFSDVPEIEIEIVERPQDPPLGVGEAAVGPMTAALMNAASRGLGTRIMEMPLSRDRLTALLLA